MHGLPCAAGIHYTRNDPFAYDGLNRVNVTRKIRKFKGKLTQENPPKARDALHSAIYDATDLQPPYSHTVAI
jgi:hypothetical protein